MQLSKMKQYICVSVVWFNGSKEVGGETNEVHGNEEETKII